MLLISSDQWNETIYLYFLHLVQNYDYPVLEAEYLD